MLRVVVTYDISSDKLRKRVSDCCLDYGLDRQQYSVFTGLLKPIHVRALASAVPVHPKACDDYPDGRR
jgi:CRISPR-associated protein Cas2